MTEDEWLSGSDPLPMLDFLATTATDRKLRLFACACVRRVWHLLSDERSRSAIQVAERCADGQADHRELLSARDDAREAKHKLGWPIGPDSDAAAPWRAAGAAQDATRDSARSAARNCVWEASRAMNIHDTNHCDDGELRQQAGLVRDIFGNPFRPVNFAASWRIPSVVALAERIYETSAFERTNELADALERAACSVQMILEHCRRPVEHVRGCWVVDLVLRKA